MLGHRSVKVTEKYYARGTFVARSNSKPTCDGHGVTLQRVMKGTPQVYETKRTTLTERNAIAKLVEAGGVEPRSGTDTSNLLILLTP